MENYKTPPHKLSHTLYKDLFKSLPHLQLTGRLPQAI